MRYLKEYNTWNSEKQQYRNIDGESFEQAVRECFIEFEDRDWYWKTYSSKTISQYHYPNYLYTMIEPEYENVPAHSRNEYIDITGTMNKSGEIKWDKKELTFKNYAEHFKPGIEKVKEESEDFITSVNRLNEMTGQGFDFSYNNRGGVIKNKASIIITGRL